MPITRRGFLSGTGAAAASTTKSLSMAQAQEPSTSAQPSPEWNVLILLADDLRYDALGALLNRVVRTPNIDALAERGVLFVENFVTTSICPVSRASIFLGQYAHRHKIWDFDTPLSESQLELAYFRRFRHTHRVGFIGKWGLGGPLPAESFDFWSGYSGQGRYFDTPEHKDQHLTDRQTAAAVDFIAQAAKENKPFVLTLSYKAPHPQDGEAPEFPASAEFADWYKNVTMPRPATATEAHFDRLPGFLQNSESRRRWQSRFGNEESFQETVRQYYRLVSGVDASVGRIVDRLASLQQLDNTLIVFTSDNGFMFGEHGLAGKWWMFEESIRVPLLICPPQSVEAPGGRIEKATTLNIDIAPTLMNAFGMPIPASCQGKSIWPIVKGREEQIRDEFYYEHFFEHPTIGKSEGVRTKTWKYISWPGQTEHEEMLFNLIEDPQEENDLSGDPRFSEEKARLRQRMLDLRRDLDP